MTDLNTLALPDLYRRLAGEESGGSLVRRLLELARDEDLGAPARDVTSALCANIDPKPAQARLTMRRDGVVSGLAVAPAVLEVFAPDVFFAAEFEDGRRAEAGQILGTLLGPRDQLLAAERTLLNLLSRLTGVATQTRRYADAVPAGAPARLLDTRKTTPGLRLLEKYAVRCGGGHVHRVGLHDAVLIKDNHLAGVGIDDLAAFLRTVGERAAVERERGTIQFVEVEVDTLEQFAKLLDVDDGLIDIALLDNMSLTDLERAVAMRDAAQPGVLLEASGGVTLESIPAIASAGVDRISCGALTHQAVSLDIGLDAAA